MKKFPAGSYNVQFGTSLITFELVYAERKTLAVNVYPDSSVVVDAPLNTKIELVTDFVYKRAAWILRKQREFSRYPINNAPPREYVSGESYRYLGRQYRLKIIADPVERVVLTRGYLTVGTSNPADYRRVKGLIERWYRRQAKRVFTQGLAECFPKLTHLGIPFPELHVKPMQARWGSCSPSQRITLNLKLIQAPKDLIYYVILHELCHLKELNHSRAFYTLLDYVLPDWRTLKQRLNEFEFHEIA